MRHKTCTCRDSNSFVRFCNCFSAVSNSSVSCCIFSLLMRIVSLHLFSRSSSRFTCTSHVHRTTSSINYIVIITLNHCHHHHHHPFTNIMQHVEYWVPVATVRARYSILGSHLLDIMELPQVQPYTLFRLQKPRRDLYNLLVISGQCTGPKLTMASALDSMLSSPKVKVKVRVGKSL